MSCRESSRWPDAVTRWQCLVMLVLVPLATGCESKSAHVQVRGTVTLDGKPLTLGRVQFQPAVGQVATGEISPQGVFTLSTHIKNDGVLPGTYRVTVSAYDPTVADPGPQHLLVPARYTRAGTSGLEVTIFPGTKEPVKVDLVSDESAAAGSTDGSQRPDEPAVTSAPGDGAAAATP